MNLAYYEFFFANPQEVSPAFHVEVVVEIPGQVLQGSHADEVKTALAIAHKAINDALDYDENSFVALSDESSCRPDEAPEMTLEAPTETLKDGGRVWVRIIS